MIRAVNGQGRAESPTEVLLAGFLALCELETRLRARLNANVDAAEMALQAARDEPWVKGSTGQPKPHPGFAVARGCDETALALYREITRGVDELRPELAKLLAPGRAPFHA
jgi:hypothetical protein